VPGLRLESILGHCERHALLHMASECLTHWTTWAGHDIVEKVLLFNKLFPIVGLYLWN